MTIREDEGFKRKPQQSSEPHELMFEIVKDDPKARPAKLVRRWMSQVQSDQDLLEAALLAQGNHELVIALNRIDGNKKKKAMPDKDAMTAMRKRLVLKIGAQILSFTAENGKLIQDQTHADLEELVNNNARRSNIYHELKKRVKGDKTVGESMTEDHWRSLIGKVGDTDELAKLFR